MEVNDMSEAVKAVDQARRQAVRLASDLQRKLESRGASGPLLSKLQGKAADGLCMGSPLLAEVLKKVVPHFLIRRMQLYRGWRSVLSPPSRRCLSVCLSVCLSEHFDLFPVGAGGCQGNQGDQGGEHASFDPP
jgi:hypothetical protein